MDPILPRIDGPERLATLSRGELEQLCAELREEIISTVSHTGGHLGASLGVVELTVALHHVFRSPQDKIVWDVGHQAYGHKLLTGRREGFQTLRQKGGVSGFPRRSESPHDAFGAGHASTSISAALGYARARDARGEKNHVIAVVGDGALTGGLAYEGLNNAGQLQTDVTVILNDNEMSISPNVGAIARHLTRITSGRTYTRLEGGIWSLLGRGPGGRRLQILAGRIKESLKHLVVPTILFEELGFNYFGPIDGHDLGLVIDTLRAVRELRGPVLVHLITRKGKGYAFAEQDQLRYHGVGSFDKAEGIKSVPAPVPTYTEVFGRALVDLARADPRVHAITAAMPEGTGLNDFRAEFPGRFYDVGIAEQHAVTFAAGLACAGQRPVVAVYSTFLQRAFDQLVHDVALQGLPVVFAIDRGGLVGEDGPTHHGVFDLSYLRLIPNLVVMAPKDEDELRHLLATALARDDGPTALRYPRSVGLGVALAGAPSPLPIGQAETLVEGDDVCLLALGAMVRPALEAAQWLQRAGLFATVVNARFVKPLDEELLERLWAQHRLIVTVEENTVCGGFGSAVLEWAAARPLAAPVRVLTLGVPDRFIEQGTRKEQLAETGLTGEQIGARILQEISRAASPRQARSVS
ncbi:MAG: 1-deoxy-D-xylulose-5-phosphate synthase [Candidatus Krumholzibacteriia bacterium]